MAEKKYMSSPEIMALYKKGRRDFTNIICTSNDFISLDLSGIDFSDSNMEYSGFENTNLTGANFTRCNLQWSSFAHATLRNTNFTKANLSYSIFNDAIFDKTVMKGADLSWCLLFNVNLHAADITNANIATIATHPSQITASGTVLVQEKLEKLKHKLPFDLWFVLKSSVNKNMYEAQKKQKLDISESRTYELGRVGLSGHDTPSENVYMGSKMTYGVKDNAYRNRHAYMK